MAENVAARELADLMQSQQAAQENASREARAAREAGTQGGRMAMRQDSDKKADFSLPEALATATVGSFILGPVGGLLVGAAQGWLGKREKQNILDQAASRNEALSDSRSILRGQVETLREGAVTPEDIDQLDVLNAQQEAAFKMLTSGDDLTQQQGMSMLQSVQTELNGFARAQEQQRIDNEVLEGELQRELGEQSFNRYREIKADYDTDTDSLMKQNRFGNTVLELLENGTPAQIQAAIITNAKFWDPDSAALAGEVENAASFDQSVVGTIRRTLEQLNSGEQLTLSQRRDMAEAVLTAKRQVMSELRAAEGRAYKDLADAEVDVKYWDNFARSDTMPQYQLSAEFLAVPFGQQPEQTPTTDEGLSKQAGSTRRRQRRRRAIN